MNKWLIKYFLKKYDHKIWLMCGDIAERFHDKETGDYYDLQDKLYYWILSGIKNYD